MAKRTLVVRKFIASQIGSSLVNVMIAGAAVAAGGVYLMGTSQEQKLVSKRAEVRGARSIIRREVAEALSDPAVCLKTMEWGVSNSVVGDFDVPMVKSVSDEMMYDSTMSIHGHRILKMEFSPLDYIPDASYHYQPAEFSLLLESTNPKEKGRTIKVKIPLFTMMNGDRIASCMSNDSGSVSDAYKSACEILGGSYAEGEGQCLGLFGQSSYLWEHLFNHFCSQSPDSCNRLVLPGQECVGPQYRDVRGNDYGNWVVGGVDTTGNVICRCLPLRACPTAAEKAAYCENTHLGTDGCSTDCGNGTKTDGACASCTDSTWKPDASAVCSGLSFSQVSNCGTVRPATGSMAETYSPAPDTVCAGQTFTQKSNCENFRYNVAGTKNCSCTISRPRKWTQTVDGTTYDCSEVAAGDITIPSGDEYVATTADGATNSGSARYVCDEGNLLVTQRVCNPIKKTLNCNIHYKLNFDGAGFQGSNGNWAWTKNKARENCGSSGCTLRMGVDCPDSDAEIRLIYHIKIHGRWSPQGTTPWSKMDSITKWGNAVGWKDSDDDECGRHSGSEGGCGTKVVVETRGGGKCSVSYGWAIEYRKAENKDGAPAHFYCTNKKGSPTCEEHACNEDKGCGYMAKLDCSI